MRVHQAFSLDGFNGSRRTSGLAPPVPMGHRVRRLAMAATTVPIAAGEDRMRVRKSRLASKLPVDCASRLRRPIGLLRELVDPERQSWRARAAEVEVIEVKWCRLPM